jgi:hypothetical protein
VAVDFTQYTPPGVYVQTEAQGVYAPQSLPVQAVTLIGVSRGYQTTSQTLSLTDSDESPDLQVVKFNGVVLVEGTDYTLVRGVTPADFTTIARKNTSTVVAAGEQVTASYSYADDAYYLPKAFDDYLSVEQVYGASMVNSTPEDPNASHVSSPLSLAARIAFQNGTGLVVCVALAPTVLVNGTPSSALDVRFQNAYKKVENDYATTLLVPVFQAGGSEDAAAYTSAFPALVSDARAHCENQASDGYGRIALVGADTIYDEATTPFDEVAENVKSERVVMAYPHRLSFHNSNLGQATEVGGCYLAAAYAGMLASNAINRGITQQVVSGFTGIGNDLRSQMDTLFKNNLSANGVAVTENGRNNRLQCRHGVTTKAADKDLTTSEISVVRAGDALFQLVSEGVTDADLIGDPIDEEMTIKVKGIVTGILESAMSDDVILAYLDVQVRQQELPSGDPTAIECMFVYRPFLPLNYITVVFSMDLTTGQVTVEDTEVTT